MERAFPPGDADERTVLTGFLDWQRTTVSRKVDGLSSDAAHRSLIPTSPLMTVAGIVSHLRHTERNLIAGSFPSLAGAAAPRNEDPNEEGGGWSVDAQSPIHELVSSYEAECDRSRQVISQVELDSLQEHTPARFTPVTARWILTHQIEETARHLGHLDVVREQLDGSRGY